MKVLSRRDWNLLKYPTYPEVQVVAQPQGKTSLIQIQTMVKIDDEGYYLPCIISREIAEIQALGALEKLMEESVVDILSTYKINEEDEDLHKVEE